MGSNHSGIAQAKDFIPPRNDVIIQRVGRSKKGKRIIFDQCLKQAENRSPGGNDVVIQRIGRQKKGKRIIFNNTEDEHRSPSSKGETNTGRSLLQRQFQAAEKSVVVVTEAETHRESVDVITDAGRQTKRPAEGKSDEKAQSPEEGKLSDKKISKANEKAPQFTSAGSMVILPSGISTTASASSRLTSSTPKLRGASNITPKS